MTQPAILTCGDDDILIAPLSDDAHDHDAPITEPATAESDPDGGDDDQTLIDDDPETRAANRAALLARISRARCVR